MGLLKKVKDIWKKGVDEGESTISGYSVRNQLMMSDIGTGSNNYFTLNEVSLYVNRGISKRAEKVGEIQFQLFDRKTGEEILDNEWTTLLDKPNDHQTGDHFWKLASLYRDISGFAVIRKIGTDAVFKENQKITSLEILNSNYVTKNYQHGKIVSFTYLPLGGTAETIPFEDCIYWINPNPRLPTEGVSLLKAGLYSLDTDNQLSRYQNAIIKNGGQMDTVFTFESDLTETQVKEAEAKYKAKKDDAGKADVPFFIGGKTKIERLGLTPSELAYLESRKLYARDMVVITGVPLDLLGLSTEQTYANADASYRIFLRECIRPIHRDLVNLLDWQLIPEEFDLRSVDPTPEDIDATIRKITALYATDSATMNERRAMFGLEKLDDEKADEVFVSYAKTPLSESSTPVITPTKKKSLNTSIVELFRDKTFRDMYRKVARKRADRREAIFLGEIKNYFEDQKARVLKKLDLHKSMVKSLIDDVLNEDLEISIARGMAIPLLRKFLIEAGKEAVDLHDTVTHFSMTHAIETWLQKRADLFSEQITDTTYDRLKAQFRESIEAGESREQLVKRIESVYDAFDENRAKTIARTEVHGAVQKGNFEGAEQSGATIKIWVSVLDDRTRDSHAELDGEEVNKDQEFSNGLMFAGDPNGEPEETINCRCSTV